MFKYILVAVLAIGILSLGVRFATQALFTDTQAVGSNTFTTGTVDISTSPTSALLTFSAMAPGDAITDDIVVTNGGTLALRYAISGDATDDDSKGLRTQLGATIKTIDVTTPLTPCDNFDGTQLYTSGNPDDGGKLVGDSAAGEQAGDRTLAAGASETLCIRVSLSSDAGNSFQNATTTVTFTFDAEQTTNNP
jgi:hypothetical protein